MIFNTKSTFLIVHKNLQYALQLSDDTQQKTMWVQIGPINQRNKRQLWLFDQVTEHIEIINAFTDTSLTQDDDRVILKRGEQSKHQLWVLEKSKDNDVFIRLAKGKNKYLCVSQGELKIKEGQFQGFADLWTIQSVDNNEQLNKTCFIKSIDNGKLLDVPEASHKPTQLIIYKPINRYNQRWTILRAGEVFVIKSFFTKMNLDVSGEKFQDENEVIQYEGHGGINQFWMFQPIDQGKNIFRISTFYDRQFQLGHKNGAVIIHKGRHFCWEIDGFFPQ